MARLDGKLITTETKFSVEVTVTVWAENDDMTRVRKSEVAHRGFTLQQAYDLARKIEQHHAEATGSMFEQNVRVPQPVGHGG